MTFEIALLLLQDALATGAIYVLMALGIVLIFNVTRVIFVPYGDLVAYSALTLASFELNRMPGTVWLVALLAPLAFATEAGSLIRRKRADRIARAFVYWALIPSLPALAAAAVGTQHLATPLAMLLTLALVLPLGALLYRIVLPSLPALAAAAVGTQPLAPPLAMLLTVALVLPLGPLLYRIVFQPIASAPVLVLFMVAVALHFAVSGLALL